MKITEQIKTFPKDELHVTGRPTEPFFETVIDGAKLIALADSHERLLASMRSTIRLGIPQGHEETCECVICKAWVKALAAIEEAEKI